MWWWAKRPLFPRLKKALRAGLVSAPLFVLALLALWLAPLAGCAGYKVGPPPTVLPQGITSLAIQGVSNPTMEYWLGPRLRNELRNEFFRRGITAWEDEKNADGLMKIDVSRFTLPSALKDVADVTLKFSAVLVVEAQVVRRADSALVWESGPIMVRRSFYGGERQEAEKLVVELAAQEIADRMAHAY